MVVELMTKAGFFNFGDFMPSSVASWLDFGGFELGTKHIHKKFDAESYEQNKEKQDFLDVLMAQQENCRDDERLSMTNIKAVLLNIFTAGTDTSSSIIEWALAEMLKNPKILNQAQKEMDRVIGRNRRLEESNIPKLPYLQAICKETFRKHPSTPLNLPRFSAEACEIRLENISNLYNLDLEGGSVPVLEWGLCLLSAFWAHWYTLLIRN
ncbi:hypothetical protein ACSBR2_033783 [Camellia fascicularis]